MKKKLRIVLDVGHGGADPGVSGYLALKEKNITLDLARRTRNLLRKNGFNVYLTRNKDKTMSLLERSELAASLKADLFVSLHVNSAGGLSKINGIETYYLKSDYLNRPTSSSGFLVLSSQKSLVSKDLVRNNKSLIGEIEGFMGRKNNLTKHFACSLQSGLINFLKKQGVKVSDRGVKRSLSRILLRSDVPTALVEVGFLTNKDEAKRIANPSYRQFLARGISSGIFNYIGRSL